MTEEPDSARLYLDTSVIAAAMARDWPQTKPCQALLRAVGKGELRATTSAETLRELLSFLQAHDEDHAALVATPCLEILFGPLAQVAAADALLASELLGSVPQLSSRLAVHVAVAMRLNCTELVTLSQIPEAGLPLRCAPPISHKEEL